MNKRGMKNKLAQLETHLVKLTNEVRSIIGDIDRELDVQRKINEKIKMMCDENGCEGKK